jgi:hypothetical protein
MKRHVPIHLTDNWIVDEMSRRQALREEGKSDRTTYIRRKHISIRECIALAEQLRK